MTTAGTQIRAHIDNDTVGEYADAMQDATNKFPPVVVFHDGNQFTLADGFHRVMAASRNGFMDIEAEVRKGTKTDALRYALSANSIHGLKRTNADKRRCVELALTEWPNIADAEIGRLCGVSQPFVGVVRKELKPITVIDSEEPITRIGRDGKKRKVKAKSNPETADQAQPPEAKACERAQSRASEPTKAVSNEIEVCIEDLRIALDKLQSFDVERETMLAVAEELTKVAKMIRRLAK